LSAVRRRRIEVFRPTLLTFLIAAVLAGCGNGQTPATTHLTMLAINTSVGRALFHLDCAPPGGDVPNSRRACDALKKEPRLVTNPKPFTCRGGTFSWWDITISGRLNGADIRRHFATCWTPQMATLGRFGLSWDVLQKHLLPRRHETLLPGTAHVFPPGVLRPADLVTCDILGHELELGVPLESGPGSGASTGYSGANVISVTLAVAHGTNGSVDATCHRGNP
jgi:hypothetical protein